MARMITFFGGTGAFVAVVGLMINPAIKTLSPVPTLSLVEMFPKLPSSGGVGVGVGDGLGVAVGVGVGVGLGVGVGVGVGF